MSGAAAALPMWRTIAEEGLKTGWLKEGEKFPVPPGVSSRPSDGLMNDRSARWPMASTQASAGRVMTSVSS